MRQRFCMIAKNTTTAATIARTSKVILIQLYGRSPCTSPVRALTRNRYTRCWNVYALIHTGSSRCLKVMRS